MSTIVENQLEDSVERDTTTTPKTIFAAKAEATEDLTQTFMGRLVSDASRKVLEAEITSPTCSDESNATVRTSLLSRMDSLDSHDEDDNDEDDDICCKESLPNSVRSLSPANVVSEELSTLLNRTKDMLAEEEHVGHASSDADADAYHFFDRVTSWPFMSTGLEKAKTIYSKIPLGDAVLNNLAVPAVEQLQKRYASELHLLDEFGCRQLDTVETMVPVMKEAAEDKISASRDVLQHSITDPVEKNILMPMRERADATKQWVQDTAIQPVQDKLNSQVIQPVTERVLCSQRALKERLVDPAMLHYKEIQENLAAAKSSLRNMKRRGEEGVDRRLTDAVFKASFFKDEVSSQLRGSLSVMTEEIDRIWGVLQAQKGQLCLIERISISASITQLQELTAKLEETGQSVLSRLPLADLEEFRDMAKEKLEGFRARTPGSLGETLLLLSQQLNDLTQNVTAFADRLLPESPVLPEAALGMADMLAAAMEEVRRNGIAHVASGLWEEREGYVNKIRQEVTQLLGWAERFMAWTTLFKAHVAEVTEPE